MAKEGFFKIDLDLKKVRELLKDFVVSFNEEYNEITIIFRTFYVWLYGYYEDNDFTLYINIKYESQTTDNVIFLFEKLLTELGFKHDY